MNIIFPMSVVDGIMGRLIFMYEFMHICKNVCIFLYMYVGVHACMCVRLANDFINVKTESKRNQNNWSVVRKYLSFTGKLDFYWGKQIYWGSCLICLIHSYGTAG